MTTAMTPPTITPTRVPTLQNGDRLTAAEYERRYEASELSRIELIEGRVFMPSPNRAVQHASPHDLLHGWLVHYAAATPGVRSLIAPTVRLDPDNRPEPDSVLRIATPTGQSRIDDDGYIAGAPELIAEVAASSVSYDAHDKKHVYRRNGVREYLLWRVEDAALDWFVLHEGQYHQLTPEQLAPEQLAPAATTDGLLRSTVYPGLWLDRDALLRGDMNAVLAKLHQGLATPEHAAFVTQLATG